MKEIIFTLLVSVVCITFWLWQVDDNNTSLANERLKNAVNYAAHDASLQVDRTELARGRIVFDKDTAEEAFKKTLQENLFLDAELNPKPNTLFKEKLSVIHTDYIDNSTITDYPYFYEETNYGIHHWIYGPAVVFAIEVPRPRVFEVNPRYNLVKWAVFEYPIPQ